MSYSIWNIYENSKTSNRDEMVQEMLATYFKENTAVLSDGIINQIPVISSHSRDAIAKYYNISKEDWNKIKTNSEMRVFKREGSVTDLKIGLIISYAITRKPIFLNYFAVMVYSSLYFKYFRNGKNAAVLKYTIETQDNRTDFKRYEMSLLTVVTKKIEVIIDFINKSKYIDKDGRVNDKNLRMIIQAIMTRFNSMLRTICNKYMENMKDDSVKIMSQYSKTLDGKNVISPLNVVETTRDVSNDNLRIPSYNALMMSNLNLPTAKKYKDYFVMNYNNNFSDLTNINNTIINEWLKRNPRMNLSSFKNGFAKDMYTARNIGYIYDSIDSLYEKDLTPEYSKNLNKEMYRKYVYKFLIANVQLAIMDVVKSKS